jgi:hypothetical protein
LLHSGSRRVGRFVGRHKKASIVGVVTGSVMAAGIAFAIAVLGGQISGSIQSNGQQPEAQWTASNASVIEPPQFSGCTDAEGNADTTATGSASLSSNGQQFQISLSNVWAGETCTFTGMVQNISSVPITLNGISLSASNSSEPINAVLTAPANSPYTLEPNWPNPTPVTFEVTVPNGTATFDITGGLELSYSGS